MKYVENITYQNIVDENGNAIWEDVIDENGNVIYEYEYDLRYLLPSGEIITEEVYKDMKSKNELVYRAAFVGCTYHCG